MVLDIILGLAFLALGGDLLVRGSVRLAGILGVSRLLTGLLLVGFGTSMPELATSVEAALRDAPGIAVGNVVGSNIANILFILGIAAVITPLHCDPRAFHRDGPMLLAATAAVIAVSMSGEIGRLAGTFLFLILIVYVAYLYRVERQSSDRSARMHAGEATLAESPDRSEGERERVWLASAIALGGMGLIIWGAGLMVTGASSLARALGLSETIIGLTIVAVGTSLPELATSVIAALRREPDIAFGNIMGSCIFNLLGILGVTALVSPIAVPADVLSRDVWVMAAVSILFLVFAHTGSRLSRIEGGLFLLGYALFLGFLVYRSVA